MALKPAVLRRLRTAAGALALLALAAALGTEGTLWVRDLLVERVAAGAPVPGGLVDDDPRVVLLQAARAAGVLTPAAAAQQVPDLANRYQIAAQGAARRGDGPLRAVALYDLGNLYYLEALRLLEEGASNAVDTAAPLLELAKRSYREALHLDPTLADARYNLERALRTAPEVDADDSPGGSPQHSERAVTTMRAFSLGLP